jgi:hypothetical protein
MLAHPDALKNAQQKYEFDEVIPKLMEYISPVSID